MVAECQTMHSAVHPLASSPTANVTWAGSGSSVPIEQLPRIVILVQDKACVEQCQIWMRAVRDFIV
jgi:hypothetical protein